MNAPAPIQTLDVLLRTASAALLSATSSAEVLEARDRASIAYDAAKTAQRLSSVKFAHDDVIASVYRAQGQALQIEARAKIKLADEYDAAQERGEVLSNGQKRSAVPSGNSTADLGLSRKQIHEARQIRNAENDDPGLIERHIDETIEAGREPTRASLKAATNKPSAVNPGTSNKQFYRIVKAWDDAGPAARERFRDHISARSSEDAA